MSEITQGREIMASEYPVPYLADNRRIDGSRVADDSISHLPALERSCSSREDSAAMTIEFLRARLLSERSVSKVARQQAQQLARKALELERQLELEAELRKRAESVRVEAIKKLNEGLTVESNESILSNSGEDDYNIQSDGYNENNCGGAESLNDCKNLQQTLIAPTADAGSAWPTLAEKLHHSEEGSESQSSCHHLGGLTWKNQRGLRKKQEKVQFFDHKGRSQSLTLPVTVADSESGYKHRIGKSVRQIRKREIRQTEKDVTDFESSNKDTKTPDQLKCVSEILNVEQDREVRQSCAWSTIIEKHEGSASKLDNGVRRDLLLFASQQVGSDEEIIADMKEALEHQAEFIMKHEAEEKEQKEWEEKYTKEQSSNINGVQQTIVEASGSDEEAPVSVMSEMLSRKILDKLVSNTQGSTLWRSDQLQNECNLLLTTENLLCNSDIYDSGSREVYTSAQSHSLTKVDQNEPQDNNTTIFEATGQDVIYYCNENLSSSDNLQDYLHNQKVVEKTPMKDEDNNLSDGYVNEPTSTELQVDFRNTCSIVNDSSCESNCENRILPNENSDAFEDSCSNVEAVDVSAQYLTGKAGELKLGLADVETAEPVSGCSPGPKSSAYSRRLSSSFKFIVCPDDSVRKNYSFMNDAAMVGVSEVSKEDKTSDSLLETTATLKHMPIPDIHDIPKAIETNNNSFGGNNDLAVDVLLVDEGETFARENNSVNQVARLRNTTQSDNQFCLPVKHIWHDQFATQIPIVGNISFNQKKQVALSGMMNQMDQKAVGNAPVYHDMCVRNCKDDNYTQVVCTDYRGSTRGQSAAVGRTDSHDRNLNQEYSEHVMMQNLTQNTYLNQDESPKDASWEAAMNCNPMQSGVTYSHQLPYATKFDEKLLFCNITSPSFNLQTHENRLPLQYQATGLQDVPVDASYERAMEISSALKMAKHLIQAEGVALSNELDTRGHRMSLSRVLMEPHTHVAPSSCHPATKVHDTRLVNPVHDLVYGPSTSWHGISSIKSNKNHGPKLA